MARFFINFIGFIVLACWISSLGVGVVKELRK